MSLLDDLVSYWKLDEASGNRADTVGSTTLSDTNTVGQDASGLLSSGAAFVSGSSERLSGAGLAIPTAGNPFAVSFWFKTTDTGSGKTMLNIGRTDTGTRDYLYIPHNNGNISAEFAFNTSGAQSISVATTAGGLKNGVWHHVVINIFNNGTSKASIELYVDGASPITSSHATQPYSNNSAFNRFTLASLYNWSSGAFQSYYTGSLDEVGVWSRVLTADEVSELYNSGAGLAYDDFDGGGATEYTLTATTASFALSASAAPLKRGHRLTATTATFALSGQATALKRGIRMTAALGSFALIGFDVDFLTGKRLVAAPGSFTLTGNDASLTRGIFLSAETGTFTFTGSDAGLFRSLTLVAAPASFVLTGNDVTFFFPMVYTLQAATRSFVLTGIGTSFQRSLPKPLWVNEAIPGGSWFAGQAHLNAGDELFDGFEVYAGQLGEVSEWENHTQLDEEDTPVPFWTNEAAPGGTWYAGQPSLLAGDLMFDGFEVYAGQLGQTSTWEHEVQ